MKRSLLILSILLSCFHTGLIAQKGSEGVFLSAGDFTIGKISYENNHEGKKYQLLINDFFNTSSVRIIDEGHVVKLVKDSIFGYRDNNGTCYRFYRKSVFEILNPSESILLYKNTSEAGPPRNKTLVINYYFSETASSPLYVLTKMNLQMVYNKDTQFQELLNVYFHYDNELTSYDGINKIYFLNRIYSESKLESEQKHNKISEYESKCSIFNDNNN